MGPGGTEFFYEFQERDIITVILKVKYSSIYLDQIVLIFKELLLPVKNI